MRLLGARDDNASTITIIDTLSFRAKPSGVEECYEWVKTLRE